MIACRTCGGQRYVQGALCPSCGGAGFFDSPDAPAADPVTAQMPQLEASGLVEQLIAHWRAGATPQSIQDMIAQNVADPGTQQQILEAVVAAVEPPAAPAMAESGAGVAQPYLPAQPKQAPAPAPVAAPAAPAAPGRRIGQDSGLDRGPGVTAKAKSYELEQVILVGGVAAVDPDMVQDVVAAQYVDQLRSHRPNVRAQAAKNLAKMFGVDARRRSAKQTPQDAMRAATAPAPQPLPVPPPFLPGQVGQPIAPDAPQPPTEAP